MYTYIYVYIYIQYIYTIYIYNIYIYNIYIYTIYIYIYNIYIYMHIHGYMHVVCITEWQAAAYIKARRAVAEGLEGFGGPRAGCVRQFRSGTIEVLPRSVCRDGKLQPIPRESFLRTSAEITFQHWNRRILKFLPQTKKMPTIFNPAVIGFSWAVLICNQSWVRVIPPKLRAIPPKSADILYDSIGAASIQQSIPQKLVSNDGIPPKAVLKSEIWKFSRNPI